MSKRHVSVVFVTYERKGEDRRGAWTSGGAGAGEERFAILSISSHAVAGGNAFFFFFPFLIRSKHSISKDNSDASTVTQG